MTAGKLYGKKKSMQDVMAPSGDSAAGRVPPSRECGAALLPAAVLPLLRECFPKCEAAALTVVPLAGDGSPRRFFRLSWPGGPPLLAILPASDDAAGLREARSAWEIGRHLLRSAAPLPTLYAFDAASGALLCEDLGDVSLHALVLSAAPETASGFPAAAVYRRVLRALLDMQLAAAAGFDPAWCWDTPRYDRALMLEREARYFLQACCRDYCGLAADDSRLDEECRRLADGAAAAPADYFLHRDCQSRNILLRGETPCFIDWQGGRLGPLAYDLASLLLDPYVALPPALHDELLELYLRELVARTGYDPGRFRREYEFLALQRNMQILGAFCFLTRRRGKVFFRRYIVPALHGLRGRLAGAAGGPYPALAALTAACLARL